MIAELRKREGEMETVRVLLLKAEKDAENVEVANCAEKIMGAFIGVTWLLGETR